MIDLHCHLLPGIDDGPDTLEDSIAMARQAAADGVRVVAATPHLRADHPLVHPEELAMRVREVRERLELERIPLEVVPGGEVDIFWAERASDHELRLVSLAQAGRVLLIETPYGFLSDVFEPLVADVVGRGFRVLLAHPERNQTLQRSPDRIAELAADGVLIQVNASSLTNEAGDAAARRVALQLLRRGLIHVLASDSHSPGAWRPPGLSRGYQAACAEGQAQAAWMVSEVPAALLAGAPVPARPERASALLSRVRRRRAP